MKNIQPVTIWFNGKLETATQLDVVSVYDDLATKADFRYTLYTADKLGLASDRLTISGEEYLIWGATVDVNLSAYQWVAAQLNLTIDYTTTTTTSTTTEEPTTTTTSTTTEEPTTTTSTTTEDLTTSSTTTEVPVDTTTTSTTTIVE